MIAPLRRRHRLIFIVLAVALPATVVAAWLARPELPGTGVPDALLTSPVGAMQDGAVQGSAVIAAGDAGFADHRAELRRFADALELRLETPPRAPDVLAYLLPDDAEQASGDGALPSEARLLGSVHPHRPNLYALGANASGRLLLYSLGHQALLDSARLEAAPAGASDPPRERLGDTP